MGGGEETVSYNLLITSPTSLQNQDKQIQILSENLSLKCQAALRNFKEVCGSAGSPSISSQCWFHWHTVELSRHTFLETPKTFQAYFGCHFLPSNFATNMPFHVLTKVVIFPVPSLTQCSTLTLARLPGASEIPLLASKTTPRLARSGNWDFCWSNLSLIWLATITGEVSNNVTKWP